MKKAGATIQLICCAVILFGVLIYLFDRTTVTPNDEIMVAVFSDTEDQSLFCSQTTLLDHSPERIRFHYKLGTTQEFPYIGFSLERDSLTWDISRFDRIFIEVEPNLTDRFTLLVSTIVEGFTTSSNGISYRLFQEDVDTVSSKIKIDLKNLETPIWWFAANSINVNHNCESLKQTTQIRFQSHPLTPRDMEQRIHLKSVTFAHSPLKIFPFILMAALGILFIQLMQRKRNIPFVPIIIEEKANEELAILEEFLGREYSRLDISLQKVVLETGLSETTVRSLLKKFHQKSFKEYLNEIRMTEGARLLRESNRQIAEIALYVGFRHPTTFTKLFREHFSNSPREYREKNR